MDSKEELSMFLTFFLEERKSPILLTHKGELYEAGQITEVLFINHNEQAQCRMCGEGCKTRCVVKAENGTIFYINHWDGCMSFDPETLVESFDTVEQMYAFVASEDDNSHDGGYPLKRGAGRSDWEKYIASLSSQ